MSPSERTWNKKENEGLLTLNRQTVSKLCQFLWRKNSLFFTKKGCKFTPSKKWRKMALKNQLLSDSFICYCSYIERRYKKTDNFIHFFAPFSLNIYGKFHQNPTSASKTPSYLIVNCRAQNSQNLAFFQKFHWKMIVLLSHFDIMNGWCCTPLESI